MAVRPIDMLAPAQRFMYEYGAFVSLWGNFDLMMETLIWHLGNISDPVANCKKINGLTSGRKRQCLTPLLERHASPEAVAALDHVFNVAERNDWIHGVVLNPGWDYTMMTRFRVYSQPFRVENKPITIKENMFEDFYDAFERFEHEADRALGVSTVGLCNNYINSLQTP